MQTGFLTEDNGAKSSMRLMSLMSLAVAILFGGWILYSKTSDPNATYIFTLFFLGAFCPKLVQKFAEQKAPKEGG